MSLDWRLLPSVAEALLMAERWCLRAGNREAEERLRRELGCTPLLARLLVQRGLGDLDQVERFLFPALSTGLRSPFLFRDMERAAARVARAVTAKETVAIFADYDVDGVSGAAILAGFLQQLGCSPLVYIPDRHREGHGLNVPALTELARAGTKVLITVDCGGASHQQIAAARALGMDVIVCDHHQVSREPLPALAVLNPVEANCGFPFSGLCGAGVAFYLTLGVRNLLRGQSTQPLPDLRRSLDLVALGTVADLVPLLEENRVLVAHGLRQIESGHRPGLAALLSVVGTQRVDTATVGFRLAPRLNASGRLRQAREAFELLTERDPARALELALLVDRTNRERQLIEADVLREAIELCRSDPEADDRLSLVYASANWHSGVIGIVAARLVERFQRPTALIALDQDREIGRGSIRGVAGWNMYAALRECADLLISFGGHVMAAGFTIAPEKIPAFRQRFEEAVRRQCAPGTALVRWADYELPLDQITDTTWEDIARLEPFGVGNPEPVFFARHVTIHAPQSSSTGHVRLFLRSGKRTWPASTSSWGEDAGSIDTGTYDILYTLDRLSGDGSAPARLRLFRARPASAKQSP